MTVTFESLKPSVSAIVSSSEISAENKLTQICELLQSNFETYDWVGFYFANPTKRTLHLKTFAGEPTDHTVIPFGRGICGQVAESNENFVVADVKAQDNYIACSIHVKAEIVIPLFNKDGKNIGQIDIDSHTPHAFNKDDERFLEWINQQVSTIV